MKKETSKQNHKKQLRQLAQNHFDTLSTKEKQRMFLCILFTGIVTSFLYYAVSTILPEILKEVGVSEKIGHWLNSGYSVAMGIFIILHIDLSKRFPVKTLYMSALLLMLTGAFLGFRGTSFGMLLLGRVLQAAGNGISISLSQQLVFMMYAPEQRGKMLGIQNLSIGITQALAPMLAGGFSHIWDWRLLFGIVVVLILLDGIGVGFWMKNENNLQKSPSFHFRGLYNRKYLYALLGSGFLFANIMAATMGIPAFLQRMYGTSGFIAGVVLLPGALATAFFNVLVGKWYGKTLHLKIFMIGFLLILMGLVGIGVAMVMPISQWGSTIFLAVATLVRGIGSGLVMTPLITLGLSSVKQESMKEANGVLNAFRTIAGALGSWLAYGLIIYK